jgi:hypothetical protein
MGSWIARRGRRMLLLRKGKMCFKGGEWEGLFIGFGFSGGN